MNKSEHLNHGVCENCEEFNCVPIIIHTEDNLFLEYLNFISSHIRETERILIIPEDQNGL